MKRYFNLKEAAENFDDLIEVAHTGTGTAFIRTGEESLVVTSAVQYKERLEALFNLQNKMKEESNLNKQDSLTLKTYTEEEAREDFTAITNDAKKGPVIITKDGAPILVVMTLEEDAAIGRHLIFLQEETRYRLSRILNGLKELCHAKQEEDVK